MAGSALLALAAWIDDGALAGQRSLSGTVVAVVDGTTLSIAPERGPTDRLVRLCGVIASTQTGDGIGAGLARRLALARRVRLVMPASGARDDADHVVAYVYLPDGTMLNEWLLAAGDVVPDEGSRHGLSTRFRRLAEQAARDRPKTPDDGAMAAGSAQ